MNLFRRHSGFTLVELIIALLILSFVMVLCGSGFRFGTRVWDAINTTSTQVDSLQASQGFLRKSISHSLIHENLYSEEDHFQKSLFLGESRRIKYVSYSPQYGVDDFLYKYELFYNDDANHLSLQYEPYNLVKAANDGSITDIVKNVENVDIQYFSGYAHQGDGSGWLSRWDDIYSLPLLVKINVTFSDDKLYWPEMIIQMRNGPYVVR